MQQVPGHVLHHRRVAVEDRLGIDDLVLLQIFLIKLCKMQIHTDTDFVLFTQARKDRAEGYRTGKTFSEGSVSRLMVVRKAFFHLRRSTFWNEPIYNFRILPAKLFIG